MTDTPDAIAVRIRAAFETHDLDAFGALLADDARWGDDDHPRRCRSRADVLATFSRLMAEGVDADVTEVTAGRDGVVCALRLHWPDAADRRRGTRIFHSYVVREGLITEIQRHDDRRSALEAVHA